MRVELAVGCVLGIAVGLALLLSGCQPRAESQGVELVMNTAEPSPSMTFELRFEQPMVKAGQIGLASTNSPLVLTPPLPGRFTWLSARSGTFTPTEPLAMGTRYTLSLRPGLKRADGQPAPAYLRQTLTTPAFELLGAAPLYASTNASSEPELKLIFNADVQAKRVPEYMEFVSAEGRHIPAEARHGTVEELPSSYEVNCSSLRTWKAAYVGHQRQLRREHEPETNPTNEVANFLIVTPRRPLELGRDWRLVLNAGLPAAEPELRLHRPHKVAIGTVTPFTCVSATARNQIHAGAAVELEFSKPVAEALTNQPEWFVVTPAPSNVTVQVQGHRVTLAGAFRSEVDYTLTLRAGLPSAETYTLASSVAYYLHMPRVPPRLYFPAFAIDQMASGTRTFPLLLVNLPQVRVRAKLVEPAAVVHALRGYAGYYRSWRERRETDSWDEPFRALNYALVAGRTVFEQVLEGTTEPDAALTLDLEWDQLLAGRKTGVVFLEAERPRGERDTEPALGTQALIQLTDLGLVWKQSRDGLAVFAFSHATAAPARGATVRLLDEEGQALDEARADDSGLARLHAHTNAVWLAAALGEDFHAVELKEHRIWLYGFHLRLEEAEEATASRQVMLFSDRNLYRPGETLHLKALVRDWTPGGLTVPAEAHGTLTCTDARGQSWLQTNVVFSAVGAWSFSVPLPPGPRGQYLATLKLDTQEFNFPFLVQEFQPSAFELKAEAKPDFAPGEPVRVPVSARYFFGKDLERAQVKWSLEASDTVFLPTGYESFQFARSGLAALPGEGRGVASVTLTGETALGAGSNCVISTEVPVNLVAPQPRSVSLLVEVTDLNQQTISKPLEFQQHSSAFYLGLRTGRAILMAGEELPLQLVAVGADGTPWPKPVQAHLKLQRIEWQNVRLQGAGRSVRFRNQPVVTDLLERELELAPTAAPVATNAEPQGQPVPGLVPTLAGNYRIEVRAQDPAGHVVDSALDLTVSSPGDATWDYRDDVQLRLKADQPHYEPGQTAQILVEAPIAGTALVTVERENVLRSFLTPLTGNAPSIQVPIEPGDVPNVFVSVTLIRGAADCPRQIQEPEYRVGYCQLVVQDPGNRLAVSVQAAATNYLPAQTVAVAATVNDARGQPVPGAEVTLYAVDEGILALTEDKVPDPYEIFYASRPLAVQSAISLPNLMREDPDELRFENKGYLGGGGGQEHLRRNFLACAFWNAELVADAAGRVTAHFAAPDSLTRYRLVAVAHLGRRFGCEQAAFEVSKPLVVEPALPAFANLSDRLQARALVQNQTALAGEVSVTLELDDKARLSAPGDTLSRRVTVPAKGTALVEFPVEFTETGPARWLWRARFAEPAGAAYTDAVQSTLPVGHISPLLREIHLARLTRGETNLLTGANPQLLAGRGEVQVTLANTRLSELGEAAAQLLHYPYGCAEQTGSSLLPWIVLRDTACLRPLLQRNTNDIDAVIRTGIQRFFSMQTQGGGLAYWPGGDEPMLWASAYGGLVLALAQRHGATLPGDDWAKLLRYLSQQLRIAAVEAPTEVRPEASLVLYALAVAGRPEPAYQERLFERRSQLSREDRSLLALAILEGDGPAAMVRELLETPAASQAYRDDIFGCAPREQAIRLLAWSRFQPEAPQVDELANGLMQEQKEAHWGTTQGDAWALLALTDYAQRVEGRLGAIQGRLQWGEQAVPFALDEKTNVFTCRLPLTDGAPPALVLANLSAPRLYATATLEVRPAVAQQPRQDHGFSLQRRYARLDDDNQPQGTNGWRVGDRVLVTLRLDVREPARFVVVDDPLPPILEAIHPEFKTQTARGWTESDDGDYWAASFQELRQDRYLSFANEVRPGRYVLRYLARVRAAGTVTAPCAKAEEMYHPSRYGLTEIQPLTSASLP